MRTEVLSNFIVLADERSMTHAAKRLHISQPTLSRQIIALEDELGKQLYSRENGVIKLTVDGRILYDYAVSIVELENRARDDIAHSDKHVAGSVYIGYGDSIAMSYVFQAISDVHERYKQVEFNLISGDTSMLIERLNQGSIDFMMECGSKTRGRYHLLPIPGQDTFAAVVGRNSSLYDLKKVGPADLEGQDIVVSRQVFEGPVFREWAGDSYAHMHVALFFNLGMGVFDLAEYGAGCVIAYKELAEQHCSPNVRAIPLDPPLYDKSSIVWRKNRQLSPAATIFLEALHTVIGDVGQ